jgi:hypothetical protein
MLLSFNEEYLGGKNITPRHGCLSVVLCVCVCVCVFSGCELFIYFKYSFIRTIHLSFCVSFIVTICTIPVNVTY